MQSSELRLEQKQPQAREGLLLLCRCHLQVGEQLPFLFPFLTGPVSHEDARPRVLELLQPEAADCPSHCT